MVAVVLRRLFFLILALAVGITLQACTALSRPPAAVPPPPTHQPVHIAIVPALRPLQQAIETCASLDLGIALMLDEMPPTAMDESQADLMITLGELVAGQRTPIPLAQEELVVIVHPSNRIKELSSGELNALFSGSIQRWSEVGGPPRDVQVWAYPAENELSQAMQAFLTKTGVISSLAWLAPDPAAMLEAVSAEPGAIGFLPKAWLDETRARQLMLADLESNISLPVLVYEGHPSGHGLSGILSCLQTGAGQNLILDLYDPW